MAGIKNPASSWCLLRSSQRLKAAVKFRIDHINKPYKDIAAESGIPQYRISLYLNGHERKGITQYQLVRLCSYLGIDVGLNIKMIEPE